MTESFPALSVVIPTLNRAEAVVDAVQDLLQQQYPNFEIIVVDGSSEENTSLRDLAMREQRLRVIRVPSRGTCFARNTGVSNASGDIIVFTDDDVRIENREFLAAHASCYRDSGVGGVGGRVLDRNVGLNREQSGPVCTVTPTGRIYGNASSTVRQDINAPRGGNMSYRRSAITDAGPFDVQFRGNAMREETDFSLRVVKAGWRIVYEPAATLVHLALAGGSRSADRLTWYRDFFFNESYFFLKHFSRAYLPLLWWRKLRAMTACWLYYGHGKISWLIAPWQAFFQARRALEGSKSTP